MTTTRGGLLSVLSRIDNPRRETLRAELARAKPTGRTGLKPKLVLASASPRRLTLLAHHLGSPFHALRRLNGRRNGGRRRKQGRLGRRDSHRSYHCQPDDQKRATPLPHIPP